MGGENIKSGQGFEASSSPPSPPPSGDKHSNIEKRELTSRRIYSLPALYDLAFGYRNYEEEVDFLVEQHQLLHNGQPPKRVLELAAGPARHSIDALKSSYIQSATAIDLSPEMIDYSMDLANNELSTEIRPQFKYVQADMTNFDVSDNGNNDDDDDDVYDSAWILLGSLQHLTTNPEVISCFQSTNRALREGGTLIIELPHPRETFSLVECTRNGWEVPLEDEDGTTSGELKIVWGDDYDDFDPIRQVRQFTVSMELERGDNDTDDMLQSVKEVVPMRHFTSQEIDALARLSGFEVTSMHGALSSGVDVNDEDEAFRLVCVLQKKS
jgi:SAM-dependent methyltransferase